MNLPILLLVFFSLALTACASSAPKTEMVRICDSTGCSDRPSNYASHDGSATALSDDEKARITALETIARKDPRAAYDLGLRYFRGDGVQQDSYQALKWMRDAAERGDLNAQKAVGRFYLTGLEEMGADYREAERWLKIAASRGDEEAKALLSEASRFASQQRRSDDAYYQWINRWRPIFYQSWYRGYPYQGMWRNGYWYYY